MQNFVVLYRLEKIMLPFEPPYGFQCYADNVEHAEEQCLNAYPDAGVVWVWQGAEGIGMQAALNEYYEPTIID